MIKQFALRLICVTLSVYLTMTISGCSLSAGASSGSSKAAEIQNALTVRGIVTAVNGNEVTLDLVTMDTAPGPPQFGEEAAPQGQDTPDKFMGQVGAGRGLHQGAENVPSGSGRQSGRTDGAGQISAMGAAGAGSPSYFRTGETATYQIPVGAPVTTMAGASKDFNALAVDTLIIITLEELPDGSQKPRSVQVLQTV